MVHVGCSCNFSRIHHRNLKELVFSTMFVCLSVVLERNSMSSDERLKVGHSSLIGSLEFGLLYSPVLLSCVL